MWSSQVPLTTHLTELSRVITAPVTYYQSYGYYYFDENRLIFAYFALSVAREVAIRNKLQVTFITSHVIDDFHFATLVDPQLADNDVVHGGCHFAPSVVVSCE